MGKPGGERGGEPSLGKEMRAFRHELLVRFGGSIDPSNESGGKGGRGWGWEESRLSVGLELEFDDFEYAWHSVWMVDMGIDMT